MPALEASRVPPTAAIRGDRSARVAGAAARRGRSSRRRWSLLLAVGGCRALGPVDGRPLFGYASAFAAIIGASLLVPAIIFVLRPWTGAGRCAACSASKACSPTDNLAAAIPRLSISVAALSVSLAMMVAIAVMIGSFRDTVVYWVGQTLQADLFIGPGVRPTAGAGQYAVAGGRRRGARASGRRGRRHLPQISISCIRATWWCSAPAEFQVVLTHGTLLFKAPADGRAPSRAAIGTDAVIVSEAFATQYGVGATATPWHWPPPPATGPSDVVAVYYDYAVDRGVVLMDHGTFARHFGDSAADQRWRCICATGADAEQRPRARSSTASTRGIAPSSTPTGALRAEVLRIFDSTFAITYALELIAIVVAMLGVAGTLLTLVIERRRELTMLRLVGAVRRQVQRVVVIEAALIGAASMGDRPGRRPGAVAAAGLRDQRAELRLDDSVPRARGCSWPRCRWRWSWQRRWPGCCRRGGPRRWWWRMRNRTGGWGLGAGGWGSPCSRSLRSRPTVAQTSWREAAAGYAFAFPRDHASHPDYKIEWWYYTGNVATAAGRRFGYQVTFFRVGVDTAPVNPSRWAVRDIHMAHLAVSDPQGGRYRFDERLSRSGPGLAGAATDRYEVWNDDWRRG